MDATIVDLRYKSAEVLAALDRREQVTILYRGKPKATIIPLDDAAEPAKVREHEFFGMLREEQEPVESVMARLRGGRHDL